MQFIKKNLYAIVVAAIVGMFTLVISLLPLLPTSTPTELELSEADARVGFDAAALAADVQSDNYGCPFESVDSIPVNVHNPPRVSGRRTQLFVREALPIIRGAHDVRDRIVEAAELAIRCKVFFGSCGRSAGAIYALAGIGDDDDPAPTLRESNCMFSDDGCNLDIRKRRVPDTDEGMYLRGSLSNVIIGQNCEAPADAMRRNCFDSSGQATNHVRQETSRVLQNYPNRWSDYLEPGDWLYIYNGNTTSIGSHSIIFLGWENEAEGWAYIFEGNPRSWLGSDYRPVNRRLEETRVRLNRACLKTECGSGRWYPIVHVYDPESAEMIN